MASKYRILRGGSSIIPPVSCRLASRHGSILHGRYASGFRTVCASRTSKLKKGNKGNGK